MQSLNFTDTLLLRSNSLGARMGQIRRRPRIPTICDWSRLSSRRLAYSLLPHRIRSDLPIHSFHVPLLCGRTDCGQGLDPRVVLDLPICLDFHRGSQYRC